jgi:hypothetical protein
MMTDSEQASTQWRHIREHVANESVLEGLLVLLALVTVAVNSGFCLLATCKYTTIRDVFPPFAFTLPPTERDITQQEVASLQQLGCDMLPLTSDGWLTMEDNVSWVVRESYVVQRISEFPLLGVVPPSCHVQGEGILHEELLSVLAAAH